MYYLTFFHCDLIIIIIDNNFLYFKTYMKMYFPLKYIFQLKKGDFSKVMNQKSNKNNIHHVRIYSFC